MWIVSDIDGTLLDDWETTPLASAVLADASTRHRIVLASSRTIAEIAHAADRLELPATPCIAEDGQVLGLGGGRSEVLGTPLTELRERLATASLWPQVERLQPVHAVERQASILVPVAEAMWLAQPVTSAGLRVTMGGRWATITGAEWNKGRVAVHLLRRYRVREWAAIGNAPNDRELLAAATHRFAIRNDHGGHDPTLAGIPDVVLLEAPGPLGWAEMLERLPATSTLAPEPEGNDAKTRLDHHGPHDPGT